MSTTGSVPVSLAEIARIAGVGRAAVSNWRRRHDSFPTRIGGTDVSPQFSLAEVERWLRDNGKLDSIGGARASVAPVRGAGQQERVGAGHRRGGPPHALPPGPRLARGRC